jgi:hypothetical protein
MVCRGAIQRNQLWQSRVNPNSLCLNMLSRLSQLSRVVGRRMLPAARFRSHATDDEAQMDLSTLMDMDPDQATPLDLNDRKSFLLSTVFATIPPELPTPAKGVKGENATGQALMRMDSAASESEARREHRMIQVIFTA